jgi:uncharacterized protein (TIGR02265 family)
MAGTSELEQRLASLTPKDTTRGFLFNAALDLVRSEAGEDAVKRCLEAAGSSGFTAFFSYPVSTLVQLIHAAAHELSDRYGGFDEALRQLGAQVAPHFLGSATGRMLLSLMGKEPQQRFDSLPTAYRMWWDHGSCSLTWVSPRSGRLHYDNAMPVAYLVGSVMPLLTGPRLQGARVNGRQTGPTTSEVDFSWE